MSELPLVSIGIPTFNRPDGLRRTLDRITSQTYKNLEIIVSDNCSPDERVEQTMREFLARDPRIQYFRQSQNYGASANARFVLNRASGRYFMWAADDDYFESPNLVEKLLEAARDHVLAFSDANHLADGEIFRSGLLQNVYGSCQNGFDYVVAWCTAGWGCPFYGLYNLEEFKRRGLEFKFDEDLRYYNEGTFLDKIFLTGRVKFVPEVCITFDTESPRANNVSLLKSFTLYTKRKLLIHLRSNLELSKKLRIIKIILKGHARYEITLLLSIWKDIRGINT